MARPGHRRHGWRVRLRHLYEAPAPEAKRFRYALLGLDALSLGWIVAASFLGPTGPALAVDVVLGLVLLGEYGLRLAASGKPVRAALHPLNLADLLAILSLLLAPLLHGALAFLRVLRTLRLVHSVRLLTSLRSDLPFFRRNEEAALAAAQLCVFLFIMSGLVFELQHRTNPGIRNFADALYFTVTTLTTTGFGDVTLPGTLGRLLSVVIMLAGVTLFLRLAQALFRPVKVRFPCPSCGLSRHEPDAVHCKACGTLLNIPDEGAG
ncbi:potassium channel family protein [Siccirubricoccus sp. KC 17139]|uniref:Potassium channel family protein n=1 Tax=Siccirubricoccus soli TaxID=2899147 RepID=A0ABT1D8J1_9PROT|nr:potassium channel family protein [Siccirubricoccus soli]MCO6418233.1 potassium channel family protein [Siccirubricoccus soli]MCP2684368.1 potassium channel family protein [Siccirubricoccus soli]